MILKASAENGSPSLALRTTGLSSSEPLTSTTPPPRGPPRGHLEGRREEVDDGVEQRLHTLVLEGRAAEHRRELELERRLADRLLEAVGRDLLLLEDHLDEPVVVVGDLLEEVLARLRGLVGEVGRDVDDVLVLAEVVLVDDGLHRHEVD